MMNMPITLEGFEGQTIELQPGTFWKGPILLVNGQPAPNGPKRGTMALRRNDGRDVIAKWKPVFGGIDVPALIVDEKVIQLVEPLPWYQWVWSGLPIILIFVGGALGAIIGIVAAATNIKMFRSQQTTLIKYGLSAVVSIGAVILYGIIAILLRSMLNG